MSSHARTTWEHKPLESNQSVRGKPRSERDSGNPTVADRRGACGNVDHGGIRHPPRLSKERVLGTLHLKLRAPKFYPDPSYPAHEETYHKATRLVPTQRECVAFRGGNHPFGSHRCQPLPSFFGLAWHEECSSGCGWSRRFVGLSHGWIQHDGQPKAHKSLLSCIPILDITCDAEDRLLPLPALQVVDQVGEDLLPLPQFVGGDHLDAQLRQVRTQCVPLRIVTQLERLGPTAGLLHEGPLHSLDQQYRKVVHIQDVLQDVLD